MSHGLIALSTFLFAASCFSDEHSDWNKLGRPLLATFLAIGALFAYMAEMKHG